MQKTNYPKDGVAEKNLSDGFRRIKQVCEGIYHIHTRLNEIIYSAQWFLKTIETEGLLKGKSVEAKAAISIWYACRKASQEIKAELLCNYMRTNKSEISACYKTLRAAGKFQAVDTRIYPSDLVKKAFDTQKMRDLFPKEIRAEITNLAVEIAKNFFDNSLCEGKRPSTVAGTAILMATKVLHRQHSVGEENLLSVVSGEVNISAQTIRDTY